MKSVVERKDLQQSKAMAVVNPGDLDLGEGTKRSWDSSVSLDFRKLKLSKDQFPLSSESAPSLVDPLFTEPAPLLVQSHSGSDSDDEDSNSDSDSDFDEVSVKNPKGGAYIDDGSDSDSDLDEISVKNHSDKQRFEPEEATSDGDLGPPPPKDCKICGGGHWTSLCSYWTEIPAGGKVNEDEFIIICFCGMNVVNGSCTRRGCGASCLPRRIMSRADNDFFDAKYKLET